MRRTPWALIFMGGLLLGTIAGCTPKPNEQQLQQLDRACAAADEAERALETSQRQMNQVERILAQKRRTLQERKNYISQVRTNLQATE